jgi:hypothetical protein
MATKLTLSLDSRIIEEAKKYAKKHGLSISKIVEEHLTALTRSRKRPNANTDPMESLRKIKGIAKSVRGKSDNRDVIADAIIEKHSSK